MPSLHPFILGNENVYAKCDESADGGEEDTEFTKIVLLELGVIK